LRERPTERPLGRLVLAFFLTLLAILGKNVRVADVLESSGGETDDGGLRAAQQIA
jgi:hypothetical protein